MKIHVPARWAALLLGLVCAAPALAQSDAGGNAAAVVIELTGTVFVRVGNGAPRLLQAGQRIPSGATLQTGSDASLVLRFTDGQIAVLGERTDFRIADYRYDPKNPGQSRDVLNLVSGSARVIAGAIGQNNPELVRIHVGKGSIFPAVCPDGARTAAACVTVDGLTTFAMVSHGQAYLSLANGNAILVGSGGVFVQPSGNFQRGGAEQDFAQIAESSYGKEIAESLQSLQGYEISQRSPRMVITIAAPYPFEIPASQRASARGDLFQLQLDGLTPTTNATGGGGGGLPCSASCN